MIADEAYGSWNIFQRMHGVMSELASVSKDRYQQFDKFKYTGHEDVAGPLHKLFVKYRIFQKVSQPEIARDDNGLLRIKVLVSWVNIDKPEEEHTVEAWGESVASRRDKTTGTFKPDDLQIGKAVSYAVKVAQLKNFCLVGGDIPDNEEGNNEVDNPRLTPPNSVARGDATDGAGIEKEVMEAFIERYSNAADRKALSVINDDVTRILSKLTSRQEDMLADAYQKAVERVAGK